jgi:hypothetical protein
MKMQDESNSVQCFAVSNTDGEVDTEITLSKSSSYEFSQFGTQDASYVAAGVDSGLQGVAYLQVHSALKQVQGGRLV